MTEGGGASGSTEKGVPSSAAELLGRRVLGVDAETGDLLVEYRAAPGFTNRHGTVSGGFLAAMLDSLLSLAAVETHRSASRVVTSDLHVSFVKPCAVGPLRGRARIEDHDERSVSTSGELASECGEVVARGRATLRIVAGKRSA